jgi:hypothetical protein
MVRWVVIRGFPRRPASIATGRPPRTTGRRQLPIRIGWAGPEDPPEQGEKVGLAPLEATAEHGPRVLDRERTAKMAGEVPQQARPGVEILR